MWSSWVRVWLCTRTIDPQKVGWGNMSQGVLPSFFPLGFPLASECRAVLLFRRDVKKKKAKKVLHNRTVSEMLLQGTKKHLDFGVLCC